MIWSPWIKAKSPSPDRLKIFCPSSSARPLKVAAVTNLPRLGNLVGLKAQSLVAPNRVRLKGQDLVGPNILVRPNLLRPKEQNLERRGALSQDHNPVPASEKNPRRASRPDKISHPVSSARRLNVLNPVDLSPLLSRPVRLLVMQKRPIKAQNLLTSAKRRLNRRNQQNRRGPRRGRVQQHQNHKTNHRHQPVQRIRGKINESR